MEKEISRFHARMRNRRLTYDLKVNGKRFSVEIRSPGSLTVNGKRVHAELVTKAGTLDLLKWGGERRHIYLRKREEHTYEIWIDRFVINVDLSDERDQLLARYQKQHSSEKSVLLIRAPMPGIVTSIHLSVGEAVRAGAGLLILEAMKMENEIRSPHAGKIKAIMVKEKTAVEMGQPLLSIEPLR